MSNKQASQSITDNNQIYPDSHQFNDIFNPENQVPLPKLVSMEICNFKRDPPPNNSNQSLQLPANNLDIKIDRVTNKLLECNTLESVDSNLEIHEDIDEIQKLMDPTIKKLLIKHDELYNDLLNQRYIYMNYQYNMVLRQSHYMKLLNYYKYARMYKSLFLQYIRQNLIDLQNEIDSYKLSYANQCNNYKKSILEYKEFLLLNPDINELIDI